MSPRLPVCEAGVHTTELSTPQLLQPIELVRDHTQLNFKFDGGHNVHKLEGSYIPVVKVILSLGRVSSKGQIVIPKAIRKKMGIVEGDRVLVYATGDIIVLRRVRESEKVLSAVSASIREKIAQRQVTPEGVEEAISTVRREKAESRT